MEGWVELPASPARSQPRVWSSALGRKPGALRGEGARFSGGRWNEKSISVIYASESLALAASEYLVHLPPVLAPPDLKYRSSNVPETTKIKNLAVASLPAEWDAMPFQDESSQSITPRAWLATRNTKDFAMPGLELINPWED